MHSRRDATRSIVALVFIASLEAMRVNAAGDDRVPARPYKGAPAPVAVARALEIVKADPNLATERTIKTLRWRETGEQKRSGLPSWLVWIIGLVRWLEQSARYLVWGSAALLVGLVVVYGVRLLRRVGWRHGDEPLDVPTHVRDLDIRPESLPADIGAAARALWDCEDRRAALALLYRGMLSRLVHVYRVPIRDSTTEGECLALAAGHLTPRRNDYAGRLVRVWQRAVYGREDVEPAVVYALCRDFASLLDAPAKGAA
ncbi:MAG TPA: DUF4129 domain-containing protein [Gemmatimonadaceae bacterium]|nr:DUF4129 domain-containing protein [Gemmatimonadaceae bacterium]